MNKYTFIGSLGRKHKPIERLGICIQFAGLFCFEWMWITDLTTNKPETHVKHSHSFILPCTC